MAQFFFGPDHIACIERAECAVKIHKTSKEFKNIPCFLFEQQNLNDLAPLFLQSFLLPGTIGNNNWYLVWFGLVVPIND